jgi:hypothetical protein
MLIRSIEFLEEIKRHFDYDPATGILTHKLPHSKGGYVGTEAGKLKEGYKQICFNRHRIKAHIVGWAIHYGKWPTKNLDHKNEVRDDNRIDNLREATHSENGQNRTKPNKNNNSGYLGVKWHKSHQKWNPTIMIGRKRHSLGLFDDKEKAYEAYLEAKRKHHPFAVIN